MAPPWKPKGYSSLSPYIMVYGAQRLVDFLKQAFDAAALRRYDMPDGTIMHAEVRIDDTVVMVADASPKYPAFPVWLHLYVPDVDAVYRRALEAGGVSVQEPEGREGDPDRRGGGEGSRRQHLVDLDPNWVTNHTNQFFQRRETCPED